MTERTTNPKNILAQEICNYLQDSHMVRKQFIVHKPCVYICRKSPTLSTQLFKMETPQVKKEKMLAICLPCLPTDRTARTVREVPPFAGVHCYNQFLTRMCSYLFSEGKQITDPVILQLKEGPSSALASLGSASESRSKKVAALFSQSFCPVRPYRGMGHGAFLCCSHILPPCTGQ